MNKRARMRLIIVTVVVLAAVTGALIYFGNQGSSYSKTVDQIVKDPSLVGKSVKVAGKVVPDSWDKKTDPMKFQIAMENDDQGKGSVINVVYTGTTPSTFGNGVVAIVTGKLDGNKTITSNDMITKCPSKYQSAQGALPVTDLALKPDLKGKPIKATGYVVAGSIKQVPGEGNRFVVAGKQDGSGTTIGIKFDGALPSGMKDGSQVVLSGEVVSSTEFAATDVALEQSQK